MAMCRSPDLVDPSELIERELDGSTRRVVTMMEKKRGEVEMGSRSKNSRYSNPEDSSPKPAPLSFPAYGTSVDSCVPARGIDTVN